MGKRIVILNGSPRRNGNTSALVKRFTEGAENAGHEVKEFFLDRMEIHGCKGCFGGHSSRECPCVQKDDMAQIYPAVRECDVVVLASPLYYWNMSGQLRMAVGPPVRSGGGRRQSLKRARPGLRASDGGGGERLCGCPGLL